MTSTHDTVRQILAGIPRNVDGTAAAGSRPNTDRMPALAALAQGRPCAYCGERNGQMVLCHLIPAGRGRMGYISGNLVSGHKTCNDLIGDLQHEAYLSLIPAESFLFWTSLPNTPRVDRTDIRDTLNERGWPTAK